MPDLGLEVLLKGKNMVRLLGGLGVALKISAVSVLLSLPLGMSRAQTYWYIIIPQTVRRLIPLSINLITRMIKTTSLVLMIGVVGPSGCGKSTLLRCLNGLEPVQAGRVKLGSETVAYGGKNLAALRQRILLFCRFRLCRSCGQ